MEIFSLLEICFLLQIFMNMWVELDTPNPPPGKNLQQNATQFNKIVACSHCCPLRHSDHNCGIGVPG